MNLKNTSNMYRQISRKGVQKRIKKICSNCRRLVNLGKGGREMDQERRQKSV